jgi:uncharacterized MAPEG superfamily protein
MPAHRLRGHCQVGHLPRSPARGRVRQREPANGAQGNSFEGLPFFIGAVIIAHHLGAPQVRLDILAFVYIVLRLVYIMMYVAGLPTVRSIAWTLAFAVNVGILFIGYR